MQTSGSTKFWLTFILIIVAAFLGGILGNWVFIYFLDKYYGIPGGNYLAAPTSSEVIIRDAKKTITEQDNRIMQAINGIDASIVKIFKKASAVNGSYTSQSAVTSGLVVTSDGWLIVPGRLTVSKSGGYEEYEAVSLDRKRFGIEKAHFDPVLGVSFVHLKQAQNLIVHNFIFKRELSVGQTVVGLAQDGSLEIGRLSRNQPQPRLSDATPREIILSGFSGKSIYFFDASGQVIGFNQGKMYLATDTVERSLEKLLTDNKITYPRLGVRYIRLTDIYAKPTDTGALLMALDKNNPAVVPGSPADKAGLKAGDVITAVDDVVINEFNDVSSLIQDYNPGESVTLTIRRGNEIKNISVKLDEALNK